MTNELQHRLQAQLAAFALDSFRPGQEEVIATILGGQDCLCIMPTGGGKSLCYQLPAIMQDGVTLVVSPLIALMKDQVDAMLELGIRATLINSTVDVSQQHIRLSGMARGEYDLVYIAPERLRSAISGGCLRHVDPHAERSTKLIVSVTGDTIFVPITRGWANCVSGWEIHLRSR